MLVLEWSRFVICFSCSQQASIVLGDRVTLVLPLDLLGLHQIVYLVSRDVPATLNSCEATVNVNSCINPQLRLHGWVVSRRCGRVFSVMMLFHSRLDHIKSFFPGDSEGRSSLHRDISVLILVLRNWSNILCRVLRARVVVVHFVNVESSLLSSRLSETFTSLAAFLVVGRL